MKRHFAILAFRSYTIILNILNSAAHITEIF